MLVGYTEVGGWGTNGQMESELFRKWQCQVLITESEVKGWEESLGIPRDAFGGEGNLPEKQRERGCGCLETHCSKCGSEPTALVSPRSLGKVHRLWAQPKLTQKSSRDSH